MEEPKWSNLKYPKIDLQKICYHSAPKKKKLNSLDEVDEDISDMNEIFELQKMFEIHSQEKEIEEKLKKMGYIN